MTGEARPHRCRYMPPSAPTNCWQPGTWTGGLFGTASSARSMSCGGRRRARLKGCIDAAARGLPTTGRPRMGVGVKGIS